MVEQTGNIFFNKESLAFSMPLFLLVTIYVFFKFVPTMIAWTLVGLAAIAYQVRAVFKKQHEKKLTTLDERTMDDILKDFDQDDKATHRAKQKLEAQKKKEIAKLQSRIAQQQKDEQSKTKGKKNKKSKQQDDDDDDDNFDALASFASKKKK